MNLQKIQFFLADQREYCAHLLSLPTCARTEEVLINLNSKLAQVVTTAAIKIYGSFDVFFLDEPQNVPEIVNGFLHHAAKDGWAYTM